MKKDYASELFNNKDTFFRFMSNKYPVKYKSNIFLRDVQFAVKDYYDIKKEKLSYTQTETIAKSLMNKLESENLASKLTHQSWYFLFSPQE